MRRFCTPAVLCLLVFSFSRFSFAFDSDGWHGKRELFAREAERLMCAYTNCAARVSTPAENVMVPVETYADGAVKVVVRAAKAQYFLKEGLIWGAGVEVRQLNPSGGTVSRIEAENCVVDRNSRSGWAEGAVKLTHGKATCAGKGVYFSASDEYVRIFGDSVVEAEDLDFGRALP